MNPTATRPAGHGHTSRTDEAAQAALNTREAVMARTGLRELDTVLLAVPTPTGMLRGKAYDPDYFAAHVAEHGAHAAAYLLTTDADMRILPGFAFGGWEHGAGDILLRPDLSTLRPAGWAERTALLLADAYDARGELLPVAPRAVLARQLSRLSGLGLTASLGVESEAMVYDISYADAHRRGYRALPAAADHNTDYALAHPAQLIELLGRMRRTATASRLPLEGIKTEAGAGQIEATFRHSEPMAAADGHLVYKLLAHHAAESVGMALTFMAKPFSGQDGNSCHLHLSLTNGNATSVLVDTRGRLTESGRHAVAGCLAVLDQFAVLMLPTVNSYKRLHTDTSPLFAPTTLSWGYDNRTCALRVLGAGASGRIECRIPGADAQPHVAAAALIAAIAYGIERKLELADEPITGSAYQDAHATLLPRSLDEARVEFTGSEVAADLFGSDVVTHYAQTAWHEAEYHRVQVTDVERKRGFTRA